MIWQLPEETYKLTSGLGRNLISIVFIPDTLEERLEDMKRFINSLEVK